MIVRRHDMPFVDVTLTILPLHYRRAVLTDNLGGFYQYVSYVAIAQLFLLPCQVLDTRRGIRDTPTNCTRAYHSFAGEK